MKNVLLAGGKGLLGQYLRRYLSSFGYNIRVLTRNPKVSEDPNYHEFAWDPSNQKIDEASLVDVDFVINLAGASISKYWTKSYMQEILDSRLDSTRLLCNHLKNHKIQKLIQMSGVAYYGSHGNHWIDEMTPYQENPADFLSQVTYEWEQACDFIDNKVIIRLAPVLTPEGGFLQGLKKNNNKGIIGVVGGNQYLPWIHIEDFCRMIHCIMQNKFIGVLNASSPEPEKMKDFMQIFKDAYSTPGIMMKIPDPLAKIIIGPMTYEIKKSVRARSNFAEKMGFEFLHKDLKDALEDIKQNS